MRTPTSRAGSDPEQGDAGRSAGFTLIELLAALTIVAMAMGVVTFSISRRTDRMGLSAVVLDVANRARAARNEAIRGGRDATLQIDLKERRVHAGVGKGVAIPADIDVDVFVASSERSSPTAAGIRFFADGASTGGTIRFAQVGVAYEIRVNWFTGHVRITPPL